MMAVEFALALVVGVAAAFLVYLLSRPVFDVAYGPVVRALAEPTVRGSVLEYLRAAVRLLGFYSMVGTVFLVTGGGLNFLQEAPPERTVWWFLIGLVVASLTRILAVVSSGFMLETIIPLVLGFVVVFVMQGLVNLPLATDFVDDFLQLIYQPDFPIVFCIGLGIVPAGVEAILRVAWRLLPGSRLIPYSLVREYHESFETQRMAFQRGDVNKAYVDTIKEELERAALIDLRWMAYSGTTEVTEAILNAVASHEVSRNRGKYEQLTPDQKTTRSVAAAESKLEERHAAGKLQIVMPISRARQAEEVQRILGIKPVLIPSVGTLRFMVINKRVAIKALPIPPGSEREGHYSSNVASITRDPLRVHECLVLFDELLATHNEGEE